MTLLADENVDRQIVERLRLDGHLVAHVAEMSPGIMDETVLTESQISESVLITADKDFGELVFRQRWSRNRFKNMGKNWPAHSRC